MHTDLTHAIQKESPDAPFGLAERACLAIAEAAKRASRRERRLYLSLSAAFLAFSTLAGFDAFLSLRSSSFAAYVSLLASSGFSALPWWKEAAFSLVESLPIVGIGLFLLSIAGLLWSAQRTFRKDVPNFFRAA